MGALLAIGAALAYGLGDFVGGVASQRATAWAVALTAQLTGGAAVLLLAAVVDGSPTGTDLAWATLAGVGNGLGTAFLYRGLSSGRMGVVAPVSGVATTILPVAVAVATGERPGPTVWLGVAAALPAIWLVARPTPPLDTLDTLDTLDALDTGAHAGADDDAEGDGPGSGLVDGVLAGLGFGAMFAALAQVPERAGLLPLAVNQLVAGAAVVTVAVALGAGWVPRQRGAALGMVSGVLGTTATALFLLASRGDHLAVAAVLTSLYPAVTVVLAALVLREVVGRGQALGLLLCAAVVALVAGG